MGLQEPGEAKGKAGTPQVNEPNLAAGLPRVCLLVFLLCGTIARGQDGRLIPLGSNPASHDSLLTILGKYRIVGLGEEYHLNRRFIDFKSSLAMELHRREGFTLLAFEGPLLSAAYAYFNALGDSIAMRESLYSVWHTRTVRGLFGYMQESGTSGTPLAYCGFDLKGNVRYTTSRWLARVVAGVDKGLGDRVYEADSLLIKDLTAWEYRLKSLPNDRAAQYDSFYARMLDTLPVIKSRLIAGGISEEQYAMIHRGLQNRSMVVKFLTLDIVSEGMRYRDSAMGSNIAWLAGRMYPGRKMMLWAADLHISKAGSRLYGRPGFRSAVECLPDSLKKETYSLGISMARHAPRRIRKRVKRSGSCLYIPATPVNGFDGVVYLSKSRKRRKG